MSRVLCRVLGLPSAQPLLAGRHPTQSLCKAAMSARELQTCKVDKKELRKETRAKLKELSQDEKVQQSQAIMRKVLGSQVFKQSHSVALYLTCDRLNEVDTSKIMHSTLQEGSKKLFVPMVQDKHSNMQFIHIGSTSHCTPIEPYGILQPEPEDAEGNPRISALDLEQGLDLMVMTGLAFDERGGRLGRGGGYYDKFLFRCRKLAEQKQRHPPLTVAIAFEDQIVGDVPTTEEDYNMDIIVTASRTIKCSDAGRAASWSD